MKRFLLLSLFVIGISCGGDVAPVKKSYVFSRLDVPMTITDSAMQVQWMAINYWNKTDIGDTALLASPAIEQAFVDWLQFLNYTGPDVARRAIGAFMNRADTSALGRGAVHKMLERYLYDANSPMRNEDMYIVVLNNMLSSNNLSDDEKIRPRSHLNMALKNRPSTIATDFTYIDIDGKSGSLHKIKARYTLLFFNNPDCTACKEITVALVEASPKTTNMIKSGKLKVLGMYTDNDVDAWKKFAPHFPNDWINGYNYDLHSSQQYDLKAIPTLYLLDSDKRVLLKDVDYNELLYYLESNN